MSRMTVADLIEQLEEMDQFAEIRYAAQPRSPMAYGIGDVVELAEDENRVVYLAEGEQIGYLPGPARYELGW